MRCQEKILDTLLYVVYYTQGVAFCVLRIRRENVEKIVVQGRLYDFYGELLTEHQRTVYEDAVYNDMSLSEIAAIQGISRQGVHDLIKRCDKILNDYEAKLHLVEKFDTARRKVEQIQSLTTDHRIRQLTTEILEDF